MIAADVRISAGAQAVGELYAKLDLDGRAAHLQRLQVGVGGHELHAFDVSINHAIDGIAAAAADTDNFDLGVVADFFVELDADIAGFRFLFRHVHPMAFGCSSDSLQRRSMLRLYESSGVAVV